jgi:uncharacterized protein
MKSSRIKRRSILVAAVLVAFTGVAVSQDKDTPWDQLMPKGWNPMASFKRPPTIGMLSDSDPRVLEMMRELREVWDNAPTRPELDGQPVQLSGYIVPLEQSRGELREFLLVPYFGACIHSPPPPANQIVHVLPAKPAKGLRSMDVVTVRGAIHTQRGDTAMGMTGYRIDAAQVEPYTPPASSK